MNPMQPGVCRDCDQLTGGRCWRHAVFIVVPPLTVYEHPVTVYEPPVTMIFGQVTKMLLGLALLTSFVGCHKPAPPVVYPPDADASSPPSPSHVSCDVACLHASAIPGAASFDTCMGVCQPIQSQTFAPCLNNAKTITDINSCDH